MVYFYMILKLSGIIDEIIIVLTTIKKLFFVVVHIVLLDRYSSFMTVVILFSLVQTQGNLRKKCDSFMKNNRNFQISVIKGKLLETKLVDK